MPRPAAAFTVWALTAALLQPAIATGGASDSATSSGARTVGGDADWRLTPERREAVEALGPRALDAIYAPTDEERRAIIAEAFDAREIARVGIDRIAAQCASIAERFPGLKFDRAELAESRRGDRVSRVLHVYARRPGAPIWRDFQIFVAEGEPPRLRSIAFIAEVTEPVALPNGAIDDPGTLEWLGGYVDRLSREHDLAGSALIAVGDRVVFERCFGFADEARDRPVTPETLFGLASASKMFTALAVARLVSDGTVAYTDTLERFLPEFPDPALARRITVGNLLSHSSGVAEYWTEANTDAVRAARSTAELFPLVLAAGQAFEPGAKHEYSNSNFVLAGMIVERVSGTPFESFIETTILAPLGMTRSGYFGADDPTRQIAQPLVRRGDGWEAFARSGRGTAAGGCFSTARDMLRFLRALRAGEIIGEAALADMTSSKTSRTTVADSDYAYGFALHRNGGVESYGHGGIARGANAEVRCFPSLDVTLVLLNNQDNGAYDDLRKNIIRLITGER